MIIGASGSIGKACSIWYLNHGAKVVMVSRNMRAIELIGSQFPSQSICIQCDLVQDEEQFDMVNGALEALGGLDLLINCQGVFFENDLMSTYPQDHDYLIDINLRSVFHISQLCSVALKKSRGCIINISGITRPQQGMISFHMSKAGLNMLTKSLAAELAPVRVNAVAPGFLTNKFLKNSQISENHLEIIKTRLRKHNPLKRLGRIDEVVKAVILLSSVQSITGQILDVDGGFGATCSTFVHWEATKDMDKPLVPSGLKPFYQQTDWLWKKFGNVTQQDESHFKSLLSRSKWSTEMADAHIKVYENYDKIEEAEDILDMMQDLRGENPILIPVEMSSSPQGSVEMSHSRLARVSIDNSMDLSPVRRSSALN
jgi:NAD(P)-dependent dehydrogenase (short-subunit alcohol dehydrogenase family)